MTVDNNKTYVGIVENNVDPLRIGRCRVRVVDVFDDISVEDIPWASPWKDLNGNQFILPEKGKIVTVVFDSGNIYKPEYIYSDHYNSNLESKIKKISESSYTSMKALIFDHKTQIYSNDDEGLMIDYKFNNINITKDNININLKDNFGKINIGDQSSDQESVLGTNFLEWFDEFVDNLMGSKSGPYLGNMGAPVIPNPELIAVLQKYKALKQPKFLSKNVFLNSNQEISTVRQNSDNRENNPTLGDKWKSTKKENKLASIDASSEFSPQYGTGEETPTPNDPNQTLSTGDGNSVNNSSPDKPISGDINPSIQKIIDVMKKKGYKVNSGVNQLNIVGIRYQYEGNQYSNLFKDRMFAIWQNKDGKWESKNWAVSTIPGLYQSPKSKTTMKKWCSINRKNGLAILMPAQYLKVFRFYEGEPGGRMVVSLPTFRSISNQKAFRDRHFDDNIIHFDNKNSPDIGNFGIWIHRGFAGGSLVNNWSEGCQVFSKESDYSQLCNLTRTHIDLYGNSLDYTLMTSIDIS